MRSTRPLFTIDPGVLFIAAGLALCAAGVLLPAQKDLFHLRQQLADLAFQEQVGTERLRAHAAMVADLEIGDAQLYHRLAASQLNLIPAGDRPVFVATSVPVGITEWIDATVYREPPPPAPWPESRLSRLATGPNRLWLIGGGAMCVFLGLVASPITRRAKPQASSVAVLDEHDAEASEVNPEHDSSAAIVMLDVMSSQDSEVINEAVPMQAWTEDDDVEDDDEDWEDDEDEDDEDDDLEDEEEDDEEYEDDIEEDEEDEDEEEEEGEELFDDEDEEDEDEVEDEDEEKWEEGDGESWKESGDVEDDDEGDDDERP